jgi:glycosyltransferase involved in cell wall biosynthesis
MSKKLRVLQDLWVSFVGGYGGIPQDSRHIFNVLSQIESVELEGLFYRKSKSLSLRAQAVSSIKHEQISQAQAMFDDLIEDTQTGKVNASSLQKLKLLSSLIISNSILNRQYQLFSIDASFKDMLWPKVFEKTLSFNDKSHVMKNDFKYSDMSWRDVMYAAFYNSKARLNTDGYDFVIFPDVRAVTVSPGTKKIVRYHDSFSFLCPDFFQTYHSMMHLNSLKACIDDSYFVCNSGPTRDALLEIYPEITDKVFVIPPVVSSYAKVNNWEEVKRVCVSRASDLICQDKPKEYSHEFEYILALSTLEPRKNYINLIRAWESLYYQHHCQVKLMIVANPGWLSEEIQSVMQPHIEMGNIIHLSHVSADEMPYLLSHAKLFAAMSYIEGFGIPPIEAMQCGCPVLASDNPTHRWAMGDAALYVDPYDVTAIAEGMAQLTCQDDADQLREQLVKRGSEKVKLYQVDQVKQQWRELLMGSAI